MCSPVASSITSNIRAIGSYLNFVENSLLLNERLKKEKFPLNCGFTMYQIQYITLLSLLTQPHLENTLEFCDDGSSLFTLFSIFLLTDFGQFSIFWEDQLASQKQAIFETMMFIANTVSL